YETNSTALAGLYNHAAGVRILRDEVFPRVLTPREGRALTDPPDLLALVVRWVEAAARRPGPRRLAGGAVLGGTAPVAGYSEVPRLVAAFRAAGIRAEQGTVRELSPGPRGVRLRDMPVDIVYRDLGFEDAGRPTSPTLRCFLDRFGAGAVVPGVAAD